MKLQTRARLGVLALFTVLIAMIAGVSGRAFMHALAAVERREAEDVARRAVRIVDAECDNLRRTARDYAEWDDSVKYATEPYPEYERGNWMAARLAASSAAVLTVPPWLA